MRRITFSAFVAVLMFNAQTWSNDDQQGCQGKQTLMESFVLGNRDAVLSEMGSKQLLQVLLALLEIPL